MPETKARARLKAFEAEMDAKYSGRDGLRGSRCETGEGYVTYLIGSATEPEEAVDAFLTLVESTPLAGRLYWRKRPQIESFELRWRVRARFIITDKPKDAAFIAEFNASTFKPSDMKVSA